MAGLVLAGVALAVGAGEAGPSQGPEPRGPETPYKREGKEPLVFRGPGKDAPEPRVSEVLLGWFGPDDPSQPEFGDFWCGAAVAIDQENSAGGYQPRSGAVAAGEPVPFRLAAAWSESPWKAGVLGVARLVQVQGAWAVIGGVDGTTTHLALQLALKSFFLLLSPGSTDVTTDLANVPWLFSLAPSDERIAPVLADAAARASGGGPFVLAAATDHDSHATLLAVRRALGERRLAPAAVLEVATRGEDLGFVASRLLEARPGAVLVLAPSCLGARLVVALREAGYRGAVVGGAPLARNAFRRAAGAAAEGVLVPRSTRPGPGWEAFAHSYTQRWGEPPDEAAQQSYDAVRLVVAAVRRAGLNRVRIRQAVRDSAPWDGVTGRVSWNALGRNERPVSIGVWKGQSVVPVVTREKTRRTLPGRR